MDVAAGAPPLLAGGPPPAEGDNAEDEEGAEGQGPEAEEQKEQREGSTERIGEMPAERPSSSAACSPLRHPALGRREAQRERLNKILLDLLHRTPSKNGEGSGTLEGARSAEDA